MEYIKAFETHFRYTGKAEKTIENYKGYMKGYIRFLNDKGSAYDGTLNRFSVNSYKNYLMESNYHPATINEKLNSLQSFNDVLIHEDFMT